MTKPTNECAPSKDSDQPGHLPSLIRVLADSDQPGHLPSLIRVLAVRLVGSKGPNVSSYGQQRLRSDWADPRLI